MLEVAFSLFLSCIPFPGGFEAIFTTARGWGGGLGVLEAGAGAGTGSWGCCGRCWVLSLCGLLKSGAGSCAGSSSSSVSLFGGRLGYSVSVAACVCRGKVFSCVTVGGDE